jgi:hypothetical protein
MIKCTYSYLFRDLVLTIVSITLLKIDENADLAELQQLIDSGNLDQVSIVHNLRFDRKVSAQKFIL